MHAWRRVTVLGLALPRSGEPKILGCFSFRRVHDFIFLERNREKVRGHHFKQAICSQRGPLLSQQLQDAYLHNCTSKVKHRKNKARTRNISGRIQRFCDNRGTKHVNI